MSSDLRARIAQAVEREMKDTAFPVLSFRDQEIMQLAAAEALRALAEQYDEQRKHIVSVSCRHLLTNMLQELAGGDERPQVITTDYGDEELNRRFATTVILPGTERPQPSAPKVHHPNCHFGRDAECDCHQFEQKPQPSAPVAAEQGSEQLRAKDRLIAAFRKYAALEESVEEFECPHDAEARCDCGPRQDRLYRQARQLRKELLAITEGLSPPLVIDRREVAEDRAPLLPVDLSASVTTEPLPITDKLLFWLTQDVMFALDESRGCLYDPEGGEFCCSWNRQEECKHCADLRADMMRRFTATIMDRDKLPQVGSGTQPLSEASVSNAQERSAIISPAPEAERAEDRAVALLREWEHGESARGTEQCPDCARFPYEGHRQDCRLIAAIRPAPEAERAETP